MGAHPHRRQAPILVGHLDIEDRQVGMEIEASLVGLDASVGRESPVAKGSQKDDMGVGGVAVLVRDQDAAFV